MNVRAVVSKRQETTLCRLALTSAARSLRMGNSVGLMNSSKYAASHTSSAHRLSGHARGGVRNACRDSRACDSRKCDRSRSPHRIARTISPILPPSRATHLACSRLALAAAEACLPARAIETMSTLSAAIPTFTPYLLGGEACHSQTVDFPRTSFSGDQGDPFPCPRPEWETRRRPWTAAQSKMGSPAQGWASVAWYLSFAGRTSCVHESGFGLDAPRLELETQTAGFALFCGRMNFPTCIEQHATIMCDSLS